MLINKEKVELINNLYESQNMPVLQNLFKLIEILAQDCRMDNDTADTDTVKRNQGGIANLYILKEYIQKGLPSIK